ncbi:MAG: hypothetical protein M3Z85_06730, partial [Acidobacteriota bacterium]|nr:hypothetical protein [Acidobacteriota bacterium]
PPAPQILQSVAEEPPAPEIMQHVAEEPPAPEILQEKRLKLHGMVSRYKEMWDFSMEKRARIATELFIYGVALMVFLLILYGITRGGI